jgi:capsular exopolysaccharide synthesis family protein
MELIQYMHLFRKWVWLILLVSITTGGAAFVIANRRPPTYTAETTIAIGNYIDSPNPTYQDVQTGVNLAKTYAQLTNTYGVLQGTIDSLGLSLNVDDLQEIVSTRILTDTALLVISVTYTDPVEAADIANQLAEQLILTSPKALTAEQQARIDFINAQITALQAQLEDSRAQLEAINNQLRTGQNQETTARLTTQRNTLIEQIIQTSGAISQFFTTLSSLPQQQTSLVDIIARAQVPITPTGSSVFITTILGAVIGGVFAFGAILLVEYLDDTIRTTEDAAQTLALPVLGGIIRFGKRKDPYPQRLITKHASMSRAAEGYRTIRTNLIFNASDDKKAKGTYIVTSAIPEEGKSVTVANLAVTLSQAGLQVILVDCDMRQPKIHEIFGLKNEVGLTDLLKVDIENHPHKEGQMPNSFFDYVQKTDITKLWVLTSGSIPPNPTDLLGSSVLLAWIAVFRAYPDIDVLLFDTPPCLGIPDSSVLAASIKADVILVVDCGHTHQPAALKAKQQFTDLGIRVRGVVVNRVNPREERHSYDYSNYYS